MTLIQLNQATAPSERFTMTPRCYTYPCIDMKMVNTIQTVRSEAWYPAETVPALASMYRSISVGEGA